MFTFKISQQKLRDHAGYLHGDVTITAQHLIKNMEIQIHLNNLNQ
jgi:hypothetical protein